MSQKYLPTIGIETHVQLNTRTKLFSAADNNAVDKEANACVSPLDYGLPGTLPVLNQAAVEKAVLAGLAMHAKINLVSRFDRKHYFYPDLPKGYQITQLYQPIIGPGKIDLADGKTVRIEHTHLEEDAGKLTHFSSYSLVDLNRAGTPLIEIVSMPDMHSAKEARSYVETLHQLMLYAGVTDGDLYQGNMRFDVNISLSPDETLGTRTEIKNLNSFRSVERAVTYEIKRQSALLDAGKKVVQETRGFNDATGETTAQRSKEAAKDYRYMPEPDIPPIVLSQEFVDEAAQKLPRLPDWYRAQFAILAIKASEIEAILSYPILAQRLAKACDINSALATRIAHWFSGVLLAEENLDKDFRLATADELLALSAMVEDASLSSTAAKRVLLEMYDPKNTAKDPKTLAKELNLLQENDTEALSALIDSVLTMPAAAKAAADLADGNERALGFLVGQVMKKSAGKANPAAVKQLLHQKIIKGE